MSIAHGAAIEIEHKALREGEDCWSFTGYASIFGTKDLGGDVVVPGAFAKSLREHGMPLLLFQHKVDEAPVGTIVDAKEDRRGLWVKGELPKDDDFVRGRLVPQLKRRGLRGMSIGYRATHVERRKEDGTRLLKEIRLFETSFVSMPLHPEAGLESIKSFGSCPKEVLDLLAALKSFTAAANDPYPEMSEFVAAIKALADQRDAAGSRREIIEVLTVMRSIAEAARNLHGG
jgi:uncharacterized protein